MFLVTDKLSLSEGDCGQTSEEITQILAGRDAFRIGSSVSVA